MEVCRSRAAGRTTHRTTVLFLRHGIKARYGTIVRSITKQYLLQAISVNTCERSSTVDKPLVATMIIYYMS